MVAAVAAVATMGVVVILDLAPEETAAVAPEEIVQMVMELPAPQIRAVAAVARHSSLTVVQLVLVAPVVRALSLSLTQLAS